MISLMASRGMGRSKKKLALSNSLVYSRPQQDFQVVPCSLRCTPLLSVFQFDQCSVLILVQAGVSSIPQYNFWMIWTWQLVLLNGSTARKALVSLPLMAAAKTCSPISPLFRLKASKHSQKTKRFPSTSRVALKGSKQQISTWLTKHTHWILGKPGSPGFFMCVL